MQRRFAAVLVAAWGAGCLVTIDDGLAGRRREGEGGTDDASIEDGAIDAPTRSDAATDPCATATPSCPAAPPLSSEGKGLLAIDRCAFRTNETSEWRTAPALIDAIEKLATRVTIADVLRDTPLGAEFVTGLNAPAGVRYAFQWNDADQSTMTWNPEGLTGSADATASGVVDGKRVIAVSWSHTPTSSLPELGVRIAFAVLGPTVAYRFALLGQPAGTPESPTFRPLDVTAGGIAWYGDYLFVPDSTARTLRVFDMRHIVRVADDRTDFGCNGGSCGASTYRYVILEVGAYQVPNCLEKMSFVSLDRSTNPASLVVGEYCSTTAGSCSSPLVGHLLRWPLDGTTGLLRGRTFWPSEAYFSRFTVLQGSASRNGVLYLSAIRSGSSKGVLHRALVDKATSSDWVDSAGGLMIEGQTGFIWGLTSDPPRRVIAASITDYPSP